MRLDEAHAAAVCDREHDAVGIANIVRDDGSFGRVLASVRHGGDGVFVDTVSGSYNAEESRLELTCVASGSDEVLSLLGDRHCRRRVVTVTFEDSDLREGTVSVRELHAGKVRSKHQHHKQDSTEDHGHDASPVGEVASPVPAPAADC